MIYMVSYDIHDNKRRYQIDKLLKGYGIRVQYSIFECNITKHQFLSLREKLLKMINQEEFDSIRFYSLCNHCYGRVEYLGEATKIENEDYYLV